VVWVDVFVGDLSSQSEVRGLADEILSRSSARSVFLPNLVSSLPFTADEQLYSVTTRGELSMRAWAPRSS
jgi:hypothetical protein